MKATNPIPKARRRWVEVNLSGARFHNVDLSGARVRGASLRNAELDGAIEGLVVNGVDVAPYVDAQRDGRYPERVATRRGDAEGLREAWVGTSDRWKHTMAEVAARPATDLTRSLDGEWSFLQTLRHLVFATDAWYLRCVRRERDPFWPAGVPATDMPPWFVAACRLDPQAAPSPEDVFAARAERRRHVGEFLARATDANLAEPCRRNPVAAYPADPRKFTVGQCLGIVVTEELEHWIIATRDLAALGG